jgi:hypothetical protein
MLPFRNVKRSDFERIAARDTKHEPIILIVLFANIKVSQNRKRHYQIRMNKEHMLFMTICNKMVTNFLVRLSNATIIIMCITFIVVYFGFLKDKVALGQTA